MSLKQIWFLLKLNYIKFFFFILPLVSFFFSLYQLNYQYDGHHHGVVFSISEDFMSGKIPYKDFFPHYGISFIIINSFFIKIFSSSIYGTYFFISLCKGISFLVFGMIIKKFFDFKIAISAMLMMFFLHPFVDTPWPEYLFFLFILISFYILLVSKNNFLFFLSGFFYSLAGLTKDNLTIMLFFSLLIFFLCLFFLKKIKKKLIHNEIINIYWIFGYLIPLIFFFLYLINNLIFQEYLDHMDIGKFAIQYFCTSKIDLFFLRVIDCGFLSFKELSYNSIARIFTEPYWLFFLLIIIMNIFFIINTLFFNKEKIINGKKMTMLWISFLSLILYSSNFYFLSVQKLFTGVSIGMIVLIYLIENLKSPVNKYLIHTLFLIFLINGIQFARTPNNPIFPTYEEKHYNNSNKIEFLKYKKLSLHEWKQLNEFESSVNMVTNNCSFINYSTNLTNDVFYRIILKQKFELLNFIPFGPKNDFISAMFNKYDNNFYQKLNSEINKNNILIAVDDTSLMNLKLKINPNLYLLKSIEYYGYGTKFINIYLPKNCKII